MTKQREILEKLEYFGAKADELFKMQQDYMVAAKAFDDEYNQWAEKNLGMTREKMHPCHIQKATIEATIELAKN